MFKFMAPKGLKLLGKVMLGVALAAGVTGAVVIAPMPVHAVDPGLPQGWHRAGPYHDEASLGVAAQIILAAGYQIDRYDVGDPHNMWIIFHAPGY